MPEPSEHPMNQRVRANGKRVKERNEVSQVEDAIFCVCEVGAGDRGDIND